MRPLIYSGDTHVALELVETRTFSSRGVYLRYRQVEAGLSRAASANAGGPAS